MGPHTDASSYVRVQGGELPVRWSAIEVLTENKFSKASDVWSYGVLIFEVMSRGAQPYSEFATVNEVIEQIKSGCVIVGQFVCFCYKLCAKT
jgi:hypothetical protein